MTGFPGGVDAAGVDRVDRHAGDGHIGRRVHARGGMPIGVPSSSDTECGLCASTSRSTDSTSGFGLWLVTLRTTGQFVDDCGLTHQEIERVTDLEVGYHVRADLLAFGLGDAGEPLRASS
jgi:hypothetical protein